MDASLEATSISSAPSHDDLISQALQASRSSLRWVEARLGQLEQAIRNVNRLGGNARTAALGALRTSYARDIAVASDKLRTSQDPLSSEFQGAIQSALQLIRRHLHQEALIVDEGNLGRCDPKLWGGAMPFAVTTPRDPEPRVSICAAWFPMSGELHRDVITHEFFHLIGLIDRSMIANTSDALGDANTMAQLVAYIHDRTRWEDSNRLAKSPVIYPAP